MSDKPKKVRNGQNNGRAASGAKANCHANRMTHERKERLIDALKKTGNVTEACKAVGCARATAYRLTATDRSFAEAWDNAIAEAADALESEARRRAVDGWDEPIFWKGEQIGVIRRYSDRMLELLLKGHKPRMFRERFELSGDPENPVVVKATDLSDDELAAIIRREQDAKKQGGES